MLQQKRNLLNKSTVRNRSFLIYEIISRNKQKALIHLPEFQVAPSWFEWSVDQIKGLIFIQIVIIGLLTTLAILKTLGIERLMALCMRPFLNLINIDENPSFTVSTLVSTTVTLGNLVL